MNKKDREGLYILSIIGGVYVFSTLLFSFTRGCAPRETPENAPGKRPRIVSYVEYAHNKFMKTLGPDWEKVTIKDLRIKGRAKKLNGPYKEYWDNGLLRAECNFKNGEYDGLFKSYYKHTGQLYEKFTFKDGKYDGPFEDYWSNGLVFKKSTYKDGKYDGPYEEYYENGQLSVKCTFKNWKLDGPYEAYYNNGRLAEKCTYKDGEYDGPYERYWKNGQLRRKCTYKDGYLDGPYEEYRETGVPKRFAVYKMGRILQGQEAAEYRKEWEAKQIKIPYPKFPNINDGR